MSDEDYDEMFDEDEFLEAMHDPETMTPEDVFGMVMINKMRNKKVSCVLVDKDGDEIDMAEVITALLGYIQDRLRDDSENEFNDQIMPLMAQAMTSGLGRMIGIQLTGFHMANEVTRHAFIHMMGLSFLLLKWLQQKEITIQTIEEEISDDEIEALDRKSRANEVATMGSLLGGSPREILQQLMDNGQITQEDMEDLLQGGPQEDEEEEDDDDE
jgi:hypothetical protein